MIDPRLTLVSQYANSPTLTGLIDAYNSAVDPRPNIDAFYAMIMDIDTAQGYGLDVWGRILQVGRYLQVANSNIFGFKEATTASASPFNQGTFYVGGPSTGNYALSNTAYRLLLYAKAAANISNGSIPSINRILLDLFPGRGNCYCTDGLDMSMTYTFIFPLSAVEQAIVTQSGVLPKPAGVSVTMVSP